MILLERGNTFANEQTEFYCNVKNTFVYLYVIIFF